MTGRSATFWTLAVAFALSTALGGHAAPAPERDEARVHHAVSRLTWGPRPGDAERVARVGLDAWIERQLHPERLPDPRVDAALATLRTAGLSTPRLIAGYEVPREAKREIKRKREELGDSPSEEQVRMARREFFRKYAARMDGPPRLVVRELQEAKLLRAILSERQLHEILVDFWMNHFNVFAGKGPDKFLLGEYERETIRPRAWGRFEDLLRATARSPAMLFYLDNWLSADPDAAAFRETRRAWPGLLGRRGLLAGLFGRPENRLDAPADEDLLRKRRGLNENYAREILELHTLGVDGGYTQKDVTEVARCFTGWTIRGLRDGRPEFAFVNRLHDEGDKVVLGQTIRAGGRDDGERVIHVLATHPSTARFLSLKLARRFVADEPPPDLVARAADTFRRTGGDIREMVRTILTSPEFSAPAARGAKVKTPLEFVVSAVRASGAEVHDARALAQRLEGMGMPLYLQQPPTGYEDTAEAWVSTNGMLARFQFALDLAGGKVAGVDADPARVAALQLGSPEFQRR